MHRKTRIGPGIGVPNQTFRIFRVDSQRMRVTATLLGRLGATVDVKRFRLNVIASHLAASTHCRPQGSVVGCFDRVRCVDVTWKVDGCLFS